MGYRLDINYIDDNEIKNIYYGTKLYGYNLDLDDSLSYKFLKTIHKFDGDEYFDYCCDNTIILNYDELCLFLELYNIDFNKYYDFDHKDDDFINQKEINDILINVGKYENYNFLIRWL